MFQRPDYEIIINRIKTEPRNLIQVIQGPRQVGKTTLIRQVLDDLNIPCHYASADGVISNEAAWIGSQWQNLRIKLRQKGEEALLVLDEVQKINEWSEYVKKEWDKDSLEGTPIKVVLLGSSAMLINKGLSESLAGRYELISPGHWSFSEMKEAFNFTIDEFIWYGAYPGAAGLIRDEQRWRSYILDSLIEAAISRDVLQMTRIDKPALLRKLFDIGCHYSGQIVSYTKVQGQLQDAGNTTTIAHYLELLHLSGLLGGLQKFSEGIVRQRGSSPKYQVHNNALKTAIQGSDFNTIRQSPEHWGRWVESAIGAHLINQQKKDRFELFYWRHKDAEVDFVIKRGEQVLALEVKSGISSTKRGLNAFLRQYPGSRALIIGNEGIAIEDFLLASPMDLFA